MDYLRKRFRFEYGTSENAEQYRDNWERTFGKKEEPKPESNPFVCKGGCSRVTANLTGTCSDCQRKVTE